MDVWYPVTRLGRLVKDGRIKSLEEIYLFSLPIKEYQIIDHFVGSTLKDEVIKIAPVQKQSAAGQRTRFKAYCCVGDNNGHCGLGVKCASEVANAIKGALIAAKLSLIPLRRGFWGTKFGEPHTIPAKVEGKCGSVRIRIIPAPRGTGIVAAKAAKKFLAMSGLQDCYTKTRGHTKTMGNFVKAVFDCVKKSYGYLTPDLWPQQDLVKLPFQEHSDFLALKVKKQE